MAIDGLTRLPSDLPVEHELTAAGVKAYVRAHPGVIADDAELLSAIVPGAASEDGVVADMQRFAIDRLKQHMADLTRQRDLTQANMRANAAAAAQVQNAVLAILEARNFEHMVQVITKETGPLVGIDRVVLCVEEPDVSSDDFTAVEKMGVRVLPECVVDAALGEGVMSLLQSDTHGSATIFGPNARDVRSFALIRLAVSPVAPPGLLAFGSHSPDTFHAQQGVDLLEFVARVIERQVRAWLGLPAA